MAEIDKSDSKVRGSSTITTGTRKTLPPNITKKLSHEARTIFNNPEKVAKIISKAKEDGYNAGTQVVYAEMKLGELLKERENKKPIKNPDGSLDGTIGNLPPNIDKKLSHEALTNDLVRKKKHYF